MSNPPAPKITCANCGASAFGKFCSECGAALKGASCASCQAELAAGAKFCHRCGTPTGAAAASAKRAAPQDGTARSPAASGLAAAAPWAVAGIALVALIALVATRRFSSDQPTADASAPAPLGGPASIDISSMTPQERAQRLFNRVMRLSEAGKMDSVAFFAPMALGAYQELPQQDADTHYDLGRIEQVIGAYPAAKAQADTILVSSPTNLLGLALAMSVAKDMNQPQQAAAYAKRLRAAAPAERKKDLPGYEAHKRDLDKAIQEAAR